MSNNTIPGKRWLKAELHSHCNLDPYDYRICRYTPEELISRAASLGYEVLSITSHNLDIWTDRLSEYARSFGITLIPGMEVTAEGTRHVLVYNFGLGHEKLNTLAKIRILSRKDTLVVAPHLFFPGPTCLRGLFQSYLDVFDAIEYSGFRIRGVDFNRRSVRLAGMVKKPMVGCSDAHHLWQLNRTFTWIYAEPHVESILKAIKEGAVRVQTSPYSLPEALSYWAMYLWRHVSPASPFFPGSVPDAVSSTSALNKVENGRNFGAAQQGMKP